MKTVKITSITILIILGLLYLLTAKTELNDDASLNQEAPLKQDDIKILALNACEDFVKQSLHDPASAEFSDKSTATIMQDKANQWTVKRMVRARNGFNALRINNTQCIAEHNGQIWIPISVTTLED